MQIVQTLQSQLQPIDKLPKLQQDIVWNLTGSVIGIITSLAETKEEILSTISKKKLILSFLFGLLSIESVPVDLFQNTLACLATLTEDNEETTKQILDHETWLEGLMQLRESKSPKAVSACGVLHNVFSTAQWFDHNTPMEGASDAALVSTLVKYMSQAHLDKTQANGWGGTDPDYVLHLALEITAAIATSLQEALEHASRNEKEFEGFGDDTEELDSMMIEQNESDLDEKDVAEDANITGNGEMDQDDMDADMELVAGADLRDDEEPMESQPTLEALIQEAVPVILLSVSSGNEIVRSSALSSLNNIAWTISSIDFEASNSSLFGFWTSTAQKIWSEVVSPVLASNTADIELASSVTSIAWALARSLKGQINLQADEAKKFMALYQASKSLNAVNGQTNGTGKTSNANTVDPFQGLGVKCVGVLGRLALSPAPVTLNREIGIFLLTVLNSLPDIPAADAVEALNQIFDIYADKEYVCDIVFWSDGFYKHLENIGPKSRKMAKLIDKRYQLELRDRADEANLNLTRFLAYKKKERARS